MLTEYKNHTYNAFEVIDVLAPHLTNERLQKMYEVLNKRSLSFIPVLEKIFDQGNINAVFRSAESMGFQEVHIIENEKTRLANRVSKGSNKWLTIKKWQETSQCIKTLKDHGYKIYVTHLDEKAKPISAFDFSQKSALIYGSEGFGVSQEAIELADASVVIPMDGFTQSYNISVAAALSMYHIRSDRFKRLGKNGDLNEEQKKELLSHYILASCNKGMAELAKKLIKDKK